MRRFARLVRTRGVIVGDVSRNVGIKIGGSGSAVTVQGLGIRAEIFL
jgi:hypothetical protein